MAVRDARPLTGRVEASHVHPRISSVSSEIVNRFLQVEDLTGTVSDVLDEYGINGAIAASVLRPTIMGARVVGTATTVRNEPVERHPHLNAISNFNQIGEIEGHNQAEPGDVLVIQSVPGCSSGGALSAAAGLRQGEVGAIIDGGCRDLTAQRKLGYPLWTAEVTPVTGKWRTKTVEVNGPVTIQGVVVRQGDLAIADDTGVCFVPARLVEDVLERVEEIVAGEALRHRDIESGMPIAEYAQTKYKYLTQTRNGS